MIELRGLTEQQIEMADIIWNTESQAELDEWILGLSDDDRTECRSIIQLLTLEVIDHDTRHFKTFPQADLVIEHIKSL